MTADKKKEYTLRITNANISQLTVILCDMFDDYCKDAVDAVTDNNIKEFHDSINRARRVLSELINSLDRSIELSNYVYQIYRFIEKLIIKADIKNDCEQIKTAQGIMLKLADSYRVISAKDESAPLMSNTEEVYAGMTYGRYDISSQTVNTANRGFLA